MNIPKAILKAVFGRRLPITSGELTIPGLTDSILIRRDSFGVPYIEANNDLDAWYGLGFCHGQDRSFQLELLSRLVRGTTAELVGPAVLSMDRLSRRIGFYYAGLKQFEMLPTEDQEFLTAYTNGVNDGRTLGSQKDAHEFALLRTKPSLFEPGDVLGILNYYAFALSGWTGKITRLIILNKDGPEAVYDLDENYTENYSTVKEGVISGAQQILDSLGEDLSRFVSIMGGGGSNNWALNGSRTAAGRPILANDPHLVPTIPAPWYLAHLRTPDWAVMGASLAGTPSIPSGHNETAAWGVTAGLADNIDLYLEEVSPNGQSVRESESWVPCEIRQETIHIKGKSSIKEQVLVTARGPVISPALEGVNVVLSMQATWMNPKKYKNLRKMYQVKDFAEFREVVSGAVLSSLNMVFADSFDNIGWQLVGEIPERGEGWGVLPMPGWEPAFQWKDDPIPWDEMPFIFNPDCGIVATANNKPARSDRPYLGRDWVDGYRHGRIVEILEAREKWDLEATGVLQLDEYSIPWRQMKDGILAVTVKTTEAQQAIDLLKKWDGVVGKGSVGAAVYQYFLAEISLKIKSVKAPNSTEWAKGKGFNPMIPGAFFGIRWMSQIINLLQEQPEGWFNRPWPVEIADALTNAIMQLRVDFGSDSTDWTWGKIRPLTLVHALGMRPPLDRIFNLGPFPWGGDGQTVAQTGRVLTDLTANPTVIANLRMAVDVGNWEENRFVLAGGQSGNTLSTHYDDMLDLWREGDAIVLPWSRESVAGATRSILKLVPHDLY